MNVKRTAALVALGAALAAWLAGAAIPRRDDPAPIVTGARPIDLRGVELEQEIARLHDRLRPTTAPTERRRNLFAFRSASPARPSASVAASADAAAILDQSPLPIEPSLKLAGIAEDNGADGPERTAFISGDGQLFMVKEGDVVAGRYRVTRISSDAVELSDAAAGILRRLVMK